MMPWFFALIVMTSAAFGDTLLHCTEKKSATIAWKSALGKTIAEVSEATNEPVDITLVLTKTGGLLKGNTGQGPITRLSERTFVEVTESGNVVLYTLLRGPGSNATTFLYQQKAYNVVGPFTTTVEYQCK